MNKPTVIVLASQKGGVGKTTLAVAADASGIGAVAVYDTDPQQSLARWWDRREAETPHYARGGVDELDATLERLGEKELRLLVIDTPPAVTGAIQAVVRRADYVVVPTKPNMLDLEALVSLSLDHETRFDTNVEPLKWFPDHATQPSAEV
jgi:chromosome partitioning protein